MFIMLGVVFVVAIKWKKPLVAAIAIGVSGIALMMLHPPLWTLIILHAILFAQLFLVAWISEQHGWPLWPFRSWRRWWPGRIRPARGRSTPRRRC